MKTRTQAGRNGSSKGRARARDGQGRAERKEPRFLASGVRDEAQAQRFFEKGVHITAVTTVMRSASDLYRAWRSLEDLPRFVDNLDEVTVIDGTRTRWTTGGPAGTYSWEARIIADEPPYRLAWRSVGSSPVENAGTILFRELPHRRGTEVRAVLEYVPPGAKVGDAFAKLLGGDAKTMVQRALHRFRQMMETGEVATTEGQPAGRNALRHDRPGETQRKTDSELRDISGRRTGDHGDDLEDSGDDSDYGAQRKGRR